MGHQSHKSLRNYLKNKKPKPSSGANWDDLLLIEPPHGARPQQVLWRAVILQMVTDAISASKKPEAISCRRDARRWLTHFTRDFRMVCHYAGYDPTWMHERVQEFLQRHDNEPSDKPEPYPAVESKTAFTASYQPISFGLMLQDFSLQEKGGKKSKKTNQYHNFNRKNKCDA